MPVGSVRGGFFHNLINDLRDVVRGDAVPPANFFASLARASGVAVAGPMGCSCDEKPHGRDGVTDRGDASTTHPDGADGNPPPPGDGGRDGGRDARVDGGPGDTGHPDAGRDAGGTDAGPDGGGDGGRDGGPPVALCPDGSPEDPIGRPCVHNDCPDASLPDDVRDPCNHNDALRSGYAGRAGGATNGFRIDDSFALGPWTFASDIAFYGGRLYVLAPAGGRLANNSILTYDLCQAERTLGAERPWALPDSFHSDYWNRDDPIFPQQMTLPLDYGAVFHVTNNNSLYEVRRSTGAAIVIPFELMGLHGGVGEPTDPPNYASGVWVAGGRLYASMAMLDRDFSYRDGKVLSCGVNAQGEITGDTLPGGIKDATDCRYVAGNVGRNPTGLTCPPDVGTFCYVVSSGTFAAGSEARLAAVQRSSEVVATTTRIAAGTADVSGRVSRVTRVDNRRLLVIGSADDTARVFLRRYDNFTLPTDERLLFAPMGVSALITGIQTVAGPGNDVTFFAADFNEGVVFVRRMDDVNFADEVDLQAANQLGPSVTISATEAAFACGRPVFDAPWVIVHVVAGGLVLFQPAP